MSTTKLLILAVYAVIVAVAVVAAGTTAGNYALWTLLILVAVHSVEMVVFYKRCREAGGSIVGHLFNVFLFGVFHMRELGTRN